MSSSCHRPPKIGGFHKTILADNLRIIERKTLCTAVERGKNMKVCTRHKGLGRQG